MTEDSKSMAKKSRWQAKKSGMVRWGWRMALGWGIAIAIPAAEFVMAPPASAACPVELVAEGVRGTTGRVGVIVFVNAAGFPDQVERAVFRKSEPAQPGQIRVVWPNAEPGSYAVVFLHDENGNQRLDRRASGRPAEGWGMSNNPKAALKAPAFKEAAVPVSCGAEVRVAIRYPKESHDGGRQKD